MTGHETPFGELQSLRERPIVGNLELGAAHGYRSVAIARDGAANAEPLLEAEAFGLAGRNYYASPINPPYYHIVPGSIDRLWLRRSVGVRLRALNDRLNASGLELFLYDAWRPQAVQRYFHDVWFPAEMRRRHPQLEGGALRAAVERYWAAPSAGAEAPSPHSTGAAIDLTIRWRGGDPLWMGSLFDDASEAAHTAALEAPGADFSFSADEARANRRLLFWLMCEAGFAANPSEWWHFSLGDQMWAKLTGAAQAVYAGAEPPAGVSSAQRTAPMS